MRNPIVQASLVAALLLLGTTFTGAQSLDEQIEALLADNCDGLGFNGSNGGEFDSALTAICGIPQTAAASSSGGGAASAQASTLAFQNGIVQERLERARGTRTASNGRLPSFGVATTAIGASLDSGGSGSGSGYAASRKYDFFFSAGYGSLDRDPTRFEDGYDSTVQIGTAGIDYIFSNKLIGGVLLSYREQDGDFLGGGSLKTTAFEPLLFVSYLPTDRTFVQLLLGYGDEKSDVNRNVSINLVQPTENDDRLITGAAVSDVDSSVFSASLQAGYDRSRGRFTYGPRVGINSRQTDLDAYVERGTSGLELRIADRTVDSLQATVGFYGSAAYSGKSGVFVPQFTVEYVRETEDDPSRVDAQFAQDLRGATATNFSYLTNAPDSDFINVDLGVAAVLPNGIQPYVSLRTLVGSDNFDSLVGTIGVRFGG